MTENIAGFDMVDRDPNEINSHIRVAFEDILAEPDGVHSFALIWACTNACFRFWRSCCYMFMTTTCGLCIAMSWGIEFAYVAFYHIWFLTPTLKFLEINCAACQRLYSLCISCWLGPLCESCGAIFINFKRS